jgi:hypothetical protein
MDMETFALWVSKQEKVEVEAVIDPNPSNKYKNISFRAKLKDGSTIMIDRQDIILDEEQLLIDELAEILYHRKLQSQHERYAFIMKQFIIKGVPYVNRLGHRKPKLNQQLSIDLFDVS